MNIDTERVDAAILGLMYLTLHEERRAWKSFDWEAMGRLHAKGLIYDPVNKAKSVALTEQGLKAAEDAFREQFARHPDRSEVVHYRGVAVEARAAAGARGVLCRSVADGLPFFRVYSTDGSFTDYAVRHEELSVTIDLGAEAAFYMLEDAPILDHSPRVLGLPQADGGRAAGA